MEESKETVMENVKACTANFRGIKPVFPVCSGGLHPGHVPKLVEYFGKDIIIQMGGGLHGHPEGTVEGARAARQAIDATMKGISLEKYAKTHEQLRLALVKWNN
jgi:ribulose-bisphosphate carboxylase large chain